MTESEKINIVKSMGVNDSDEILSAYLTLAGNKILAKAYPYDNSVTEVPKKYESLQCEIAVYLLNKRGAEGETVHNENGISRSYENADIPSSLMNRIIPHCGVIK